jgi:hypothetical protein
MCDLHLSSDTEEHESADRCLCSCGNEKVPFKEHEERGKCLCVRHDRVIRERERERWREIQKEITSTQELHSDAY